MVLQLATDCIMFGWSLSASVSYDSLSRFVSLFYRYSVDVSSHVDYVFRM